METPFLPLTILVFLLSFCGSHVDTEAKLDMIARSCRRGKVQDEDKYEDVYWRLINEMGDEMDHLKFSSKEAGDPPNRLYLFSQCMEDLSNAECRHCFESVEGFLAGCFPATGGRAYSNSCFIRAENYSFYRETIGPDDLKRCSDGKALTKVFSSMATNLVIQMALKAPDRGGYILMQENLPSGLAVFGQATCWKTLDHDMCSKCLANAASTSLSCLPSTEGRVLNAGCFLHYADYDFIDDANKREARDTVVLYVAYVLAAFAICSLAILIGYYVGKSTYNSISCKGEGPEMNLSVLKRNLQFMQFKYSALKKATDDFNESHKLGQGGFGEVYKGTLRDGREIAIKRMILCGQRGTEDVYNEMDVISRAQHKNLVRFLGCCFTIAESFLIYEYLPNGSLNYVLFDPEKKKELDWPKRRGIIIGMAEGLEYLHNNAQVRIIHRDIKASNILLDLKYKPKIADFGLARFHSCDKTLVSTAIAGTLGYMAPEYLAQGRLTEKVDIYSFGILVLEIVSGVENSKFESGETLETLVAHAWKHFQSNSASEIIDESMEAKDEEEIMRVVQVGLLCTQELPSLRPRMTEVTKMLKQRDATLPAPSKPAFTHECLELSPRVHSGWGQQSNISDSSRPLKCKADYA